MNPVVLIDTDVFSFLFKRDTRATTFLKLLEGARLALSFQSVAERRLWSLLRNWSEPRRLKLEASIAKCEVLHSDDALMRYWAECIAGRRRVGRPLEYGDAWVAATALRYGLPLLTHNRADYAGIDGLKLLS